MSRLVHNDYLEQASDSGFIGLASYAAFIIGALTWSYRKIAPGLWTGVTAAGPSKSDESLDSGHGKRKRTPKASEQGRGIADIMEKWFVADSWLAFAVWLGVLGWSLQCLLEFSLYIPALSWPAFAFLGWLLGRTPEDASSSRG
jgi:O-antigen ligase